MGEADDQPHIALRDHDGSDHGPGDAAYAVRAGAGWTLELFESPVATARAVIYSMPSTTARVGRLKRSTRRVGALLLCLQADAQQVARKVFLLQCPACFVVGHGEAVDMVSGGIYFG